MYHTILCMKWNSWPAAAVAACSCYYCWCCRWWHHHNGGNDDDAQSSTVIALMLLFLLSSFHALSLAFVSVIINSSFIWYVLCSVCVRVWVCLSVTHIWIRLTFMTKLDMPHNSSRMLSDHSSPSRQHIPCSHFQRCSIEKMVLILINEFVLSTN